MPDGDALLSMIEELRSLPGRDRSAVLGALSPAERSRVAGLLRGSEPEAPAAPCVVPHEQHLALSEWLRARVEDAAVPPAEARWQMTAAARAALARAARDVAAAAAPAEAASDERPKGRSLLSAIGGLLTRASRS